MNVERIREGLFHLETITPGEERTGKHNEDCPGCLAWREIDRAMRDYEHRIDALVAERDALAARLAEAERREKAIADDLAWVSSVNKELLPYQERAVAAEARVAALTAGIGAFYAWAPGWAKDSFAPEAWKAALAAADRPEAEPDYAALIEKSYRDAAAADRPEGTTP